MELKVCCDLRLVCQHNSEACLARIMTATLHLSVAEATVSVASIIHRQCTFGNLDLAF